MKIKICGITNLADALKAVILGADALGFVFYKKSPRYINPTKAAKIIRLLPKNIVKVGVFVNSSQKAVNRIANICKLDWLQFHGDETSRFCRKFKGFKIIKAFRVKDALDYREILRYKTYAYLFDSFSISKFGGTAKTFNWRLLDKARLRRPIFLSGGLNALNVKQALHIVKPDWVDASSGVEETPGKKDYKKLKKFISAARLA